MFHLRKIKSPFLFIVFFAFGLLANAQSGVEVRGTVKTGDGEPLEGASINVKNTSRTVTTNEMGEFRINVARNGTLVVSHTSYSPIEVRVNNQTQLNITMDAAISSMDEIVVVGYGTLRKSDVTGSISKVALDKEMDNRNISVTEALQGRLAGVQIINNTGEPGGGITFNIRGKTSITGTNQPLIVVDGQPIESDYGATMAGMGMDGGAEIPPADPLASLNPNDIASVEILKDATSTAIYGSRGANGVVLITTKSGKANKNDRDRITYQNRFDLSMLPHQIDMLGSIEYMRYRNEAAANSGNAPVFTIEELDSVAAEGKDINWQDEIYQKALSQDHQISFSGKDAKGSYLLSGNYSDQQSIIRKASYVRYGLRANYERQVTKKIKFGIKNYFSMTDRNFGQQSNWTGILGSSAVMGALSFNPLRAAYDSSGDIDENFANNPLLVTELVKDKTAIRTIISNLNIDYQIVKGLTYTLRAGVNDIYSLRKVFYPTGTFIGNTAPNGSATRADNSNTNYLLDHLLTYRNNFNKKHNLNVVAGYSFQRWRSEATSVTNLNFPSNALGYDNMESASSPGRLIQNGPRHRVLKSVLGRVNYAFDRRYLLTLTGRYDGSSVLGPQNRWNFFPSAGIGWNVSNEKFFKISKDVISNLKFRASVGSSGSQGIAIGATQAKYGIDYVVIGGEIIPGYVLDDFENMNLRWEKTRQINGGVDIGFLNDKLTLAVDVYQKNTKDLLFNLPLPGSSTFSNYYTNRGEVLNRGLDVELSWNILDGPLNWNMAANFSTFYNRVIDMGDLGIAYGRVFVVGGGVLLSQQLQVAKVGYPISSFWGYKTDGVYQNQAEVNAGPEAGIAQPGMVKWVDTNGDGQITDDDKTILGDPAADYTYGMNHDFAYKNFTFGFGIMGSVGNQLINLNKWMVASNNTNNNYNLTQEAWDNRWRGEGTGNNLYPMVTSGTVRLQQRFPDWMVEDASFLRINSARIGYNFKFKSNNYIQSLRVYVSGTNLYTFTKYSWYDPNVNSFDQTAIGSGMDFGTLPKPRTFSAGIELGL